MKKIGLIGGMSWESTVEYYRIINEETNKRLGGLHSAKIIMYSFDFDEIEKFQSQGRWDSATDVMIEVAKRIEKAGAEIILICTNTMHKMFAQIEESVTIPVLHILDVTAEAIKSKEIKKVGLLGTKFTMEQEFYKERLKSAHGIEVIIPDAQDMEKVNKIIYEELCRGKIKESSKELLKQIIEGLVDEGAEGIVLGCTELPLLIKKEDSSVPIFDTCSLHAKKAVEISLET
ncbi:MAG: aspartate/glutamate racemase family protein [Candidatus Bathyarchaeota archaeon]|nr:aspartate/glutamate racemase family protein [Candidatus Bathyarchaeota archaeon]MCZ2845916.1 aspartate/glutamate racemase family protein [Candidatus Bathyarchaeota archaeon]